MTILVNKCVSAARAGLLDFWKRGDREATMWFARVFLLRGQGIRGVDMPCNLL
ncbi:MAG: hypothetical protein GY820_47910 [Gammaproteobacteria bacterium]|nr:hypothetical protein [Gammaproteobacteria bacterium]